MEFAPTDGVCHCRQKILGTALVWEALVSDPPIPPLALEAVYLTYKPDDWWQEVGFANTILESLENNAVFASSNAFETKIKRVLALQGIMANAWP